MRRAHRRILVAVGAVVAIGVLAAILAPELVRTLMPPYVIELDDGPLIHRYRSIFTVQRALVEYEVLRGEGLPHSPAGSDEALKLLIEGDHLAASEPLLDATGRFNYLYLNPGPSTQSTDFAPDTIILVERELQHGSLCVAAVDGTVWSFHDISASPEEFLGKGLSELTAEQD